MVTLSYPEQSLHNTRILDVGWWAGLKKKEKHKYKYLNSFSVIIPS